MPKFAFCSVVLNLRDAKSVAEIQQAAKEAKALGEWDDDERRWLNEMYAKWKKELEEQT